MQVFKFGGASVKDAASVKNVLQILNRYASEDMIIVVSAMAKTTNALEEVINLYTQNQSYQKVLNEVFYFHERITNELKLGETTLTFVTACKHEIEQFFMQNTETSYAYIYDQIVSFGEILSTRIVSDYLNQNELSNQWLDARKIVKTDSVHTEARVQFNETAENLKSALIHKKSVIQGFIGFNALGKTTTLGREGSDYTAAVIAYCLDAEKLVIWKDVSGVLNADPRIFDDTIKLDFLSYREAIEMTFYGAQVIHPKTIKPLQNKGIPLQVKSFIHPQETGTIIGREKDDEQYPPIFVYKQNQLLLNVSVKDFSFIAEDHLSDIYSAVSKCGLRINMMLTGAIYFSFCVDNKEARIQNLIKLLENEYKIDVVEDIKLLTIRHYTNEAIQKLTQNSDIIIQSKTSETYRCLMR